MQGIKLTAESKIAINPKLSKIAWLMIGDRAIMKHHAPEEFIPGTSEKNPLYKPKGSKNDFTQEDYAKGELIAIGPGNATYPNPKYVDQDGGEKDVEVGMIVNYWHQSAISIEIDGEHYHLIRSSDIFAVV